MWVCFNEMSVCHRHSRECLAWVPSQLASSNLWPRSIEENIFCLQPVSCQGTYLYCFERRRRVIAFLNVRGHVQAEDGEEALKTTQSFVLRIQNSANVPNWSFLVYVEKLQVAEWASRVCMCRWCDVAVCRKPRVHLGTKVVVCVLPTIPHIGPMTAVTSETMHVPLKVLCYPDSNLVRISTMFILNHCWTHGNKVSLWTNFFYGIGFVHMLEVLSRRHFLMVVWVAVVKNRCESCCTS